MRRMKDSGVPWIGEIPEGWEIQRFSTVATVKSNLVSPENFPNLPQISPENIEKDSGRIMQYADVFDSGVISNNHLFYSGQILYSKIRPTLNKVTIAPFDGLCSADMYPIECNINKFYLIYAMLSDYFVSQVMQITELRVKMPKINQNELSKIILCVPPLSEQRRIADYLDAKCAEIDRSIELVRHSMDTLKAYKMSVITEAVTKGLDPDVPMKDSGVPWIGEIPEGWEIQRFSTVATVKSNLVSPENFPNLPQISPENIEKDSGRIMQYADVFDSGVISNNHLFYSGQILYSKIRPTLNKVTIAPFDGLCSADMYPIECNINKFYLIYAMLSDYFVSQVMQITELRVKMPKINQNELSKIILCVPPLSEQHRIASYLDTKCAAIDAIITKKQELLDKLAAYKKSLIFECVTGKREVAA